MLRTTSFKLTGMLVLCSLSAGVVVPAMAQSINNNQTSEFTISQLRGHDTYNKSPQMNPSDSMIGTVVGKSGDVLSVELPNGKIFNGVVQGDQWGISNGNYSGGTNVRVVQKNNKYIILGAAHPAWILDVQK